MQESKTLSKTLINNHKLAREMYEEENFVCNFATSFND